MHACAARLQFAAARDEGERMVGKTWRRTRGSGRRPPCSSSAVHAQATAWEHERRTRVNARRAELETLLGTVGTEITLKVADVALKDDADQSLHPRMRTRLSRGRGRPLNVRVRRLHSSERIDRPRSARWCVVRLQRHRPPPRGGIEADAAAASSRTRLDSAQQRAAALRASVSAWGWGALRLKAARALADASEVSRQGILLEAPAGVDIEADLARKGLMPLEQPFTFTVLKRLARMGSSPFE